LILLCVFLVSARILRISDGSGNPSVDGSPASTRRAPDHPGQQQGGAVRIKLPHQKNNISAGCVMGLKPLVTIA
jgi:hypothetical protein